MNNPLYPTDDDTNQRNDSGGYVLPRKDYTVNPPDRSANAAADVIRDKLAKIYASEPDPLQEEKQAEAAPHRSKHQQFMYQLNNSGKDLAQIQTEWHNYYLGLPDNEKHAVWQEFYSSNATAQPTLAPQPGLPAHTETMAHVRSQLPAHSTKAKHARAERRDSSQLQHDIREHAGKRKLTKKQHAHSLIFGLSIGTAFVFVFLFSFFNEVIIAPFIQPARTSAATPLIVSTDTVAPSQEAQVIIPKINVQIPIQFNISSNEESVMETELESGVAHYPTTAEPGQNGNGAYFGHSSNNIFNKGKYKFAFVLLHELVPGDTFYITKDGKLYAYKVFQKTVVEPTEVGVLNPIAGHTATATLITCDPPGTSLHRLVIVGDQISPAISSNAAQSDNSVSTSSQLTGNGPTLWGRFISQGLGKTVFGLLVVGAVIVLFRRTSAHRKL